MKDVEDALYKKKSELEMLEIPDDLEQKLRDALAKKSKRLPARWIAVALVIALMFSYSFDTLAYYGKKLAGYDSILNGSIKKLNEEGWGQEINKSCVFSNGVEVTLTGILFDDNELVAFIKIRSTRGKLGNELPTYRIEGIKPLGYYMTSGRGSFIDDHTGVFTQSFEAPMFFEKWMKLDVIYLDSRVPETRTISFTLDRNKAMKHEIKKDIDKQVRIGDYNIDFQSISASKLSTYINGRIIPLNEDAARAFKGNIDLLKYRSPRLVFDVVANGDKVIPSTGTQSSSSERKITFTNKSEALPENLNALQLKNIRIEYAKYVNKEAEITLNTTNMLIADDIIVKAVTLEGGTLNVTISSKGIPVMGISEGEKFIEQLNPDEFMYQGKSDQPVDRVYKFKGTGKNMKLSVKYIGYSETADKTIDIPID